MLSSESTYFVTLTYDQTHEDKVFGNVDKRDLQEFIRKLRNNGGKLRYFFSSEYGPETIRPHYHGLLFYKAFKSFDRINQDVTKSWTKGFTTVDYANEKRCAYTTGYIIGKSAPTLGLSANFALMSRRPGIGADYLKNSGLHKERRQFYATLPGGIKQPLPRYYTDKIFDDYDREVNNANNAQNLALADLQIEEHCIKYDIPLLDYQDGLKRAYLTSYYNKLKNKQL